MLISKIVKIKWNSRNKKYYESKGYMYTKMKDEFEVKIEDLSNGSKAMVNIKCDYCKTNIISQTYKLYYNRHNNDINSKDCCKECIQKKMKETMVILYGVENISQSEEIKNKKRKTCMKNYGVFYPNQCQEICNKAITKGLKTMYINGTGTASKQQKYICNLIKGKLNYPVSKCMLDMAFPEEMIYVEYDGGGHNLSVKMGDCTQEEFNFHEIKRKRFLQNKGWKLIRIKCMSKKLLEDNIILKLISNAKNYLLNSNHTWIEIDFDNRIIECSEYKKNF